MSDWNYLTLEREGMDLKDPELAAAREATVAEQRLLVKVGPGMCAAWEALEPVTIVAIEGWCIGGGTALARARELAQQVASMPPIPLRMIKRGITTAATALNHATSYMDVEQFMVAQNTTDALEGAMAFFEKRPGDFKGN